MKRTALCAVVLTIAACLAMPVFGQSYGSYRDTGGGLITNQAWCWEATQMAGADTCINRGVAGVPLASNPLTGSSEFLSGSFGNYQGTASVGITDTAFHALAAAASDIPIPANLVATAGKKIRVHADGVYTNAAASLLNAEVMLCQVSGCASGTVVLPAGCAVVTTNQANNLANGQFTLDCTLTSTSTLGAAGTFMAKSTVCANLGTATSAVLSCFADTATAVSAAVDETKAEFVNIGFKFSTSNAGNSAIVHDYSVEVIK